ncbi:C-C motif chemokine 20-like [Spea bombifrons]|uniref:C-C motif chemokine 20-like n=1 Tax=Spea bombifrons TaxID=233779 RepID=UPI00234BF726|nr:C-C motif chemokine 20-like [Spea bombifrons]
MAGVGTWCVLCLLAFGSLYLMEPVEGLYDCCYTYSKKPLPVKLIKGFVIQNSYEVCDLDAIIFLTRKFKVCANPKDQWVINNLKALRLRKQNISQGKLKKTTAN